MKWEVWWTTEGDGSEYTIPLEAASREEAEFAALSALQKAVEAGDWHDDDGMTHGTAVYVMWSVLPAGAQPDYWENADWFFVEPDEEGMLRKLRLQYRRTRPADEDKFCGIHPEDHDWEDAGTCAQCARCGIRRREVHCEYGVPSHVEFVQVYYELPE